MRIWIAGPEGPSHDFELLGPPRLGEQVSIACDGEVKEGLVTSVLWKLRAVDHGGGAALDLSLGGEPAGSVVLVHVVCAPRGEVIQADFAREAVETD